MKISDDERREVARNLREIEERTLLDVTDGELLDLLAGAVGLDGYEGEHFEGGLLYCLADLIDRPTCKMVECTIDHGSRSWGTRCTACGKEFEHVKPSYGWHNCPNCGAEVDDENVRRRKAVGE